MHDRRELRSFGFVMCLIAAVCVTALVSCGGSGSDGGTDGTLCQQCGDSDGFCQETDSVAGNDRPSFCGTTDPCTVELRCLRKLDSSQRRCFPADPATNALDLSYKCDGSRPNPSIAPTTTSTPSPTSTPEPSLTPSATGVTPTATLSPTTEPTATPSEAETTDFDITVTEPNNEDLPTSFSANVTYPTAKGSFREGSTTTCETNDDGLTWQDNGNGTLTIGFGGDTDGLSEVVVTCTFHITAGQTVTTDDIGRSVNPSSLSITVEDFS